METPKSAVSSGRILRKTRAKTKPVLRRMGNISSISARHRLSTVRVKRVETTNIRLSVEGPKEKKEEVTVSAPTSNKEEFRPQNSEEDTRPGPSRDPAATSTRTRGAGWTTKNTKTGTEDPGSDNDTVVMETDSLDGNLVVDSDEDYQTSEEEPEKGKVGRPAKNPENVDRFIGMRQRREEEAARKKTAEKERKAKEALSSDAPAGAKWRKLLQKEKEKEEELQFAPTKDIAAQLLEHSAVLFKTADCSIGMKGTLVRKMKETVALVRAAATVLSKRAREGLGASEIQAMRRDIEALKMENEKLQNEVRALKAAPATVATIPPLPAPMSWVIRRAKSWKRPRTEETEDSNAFVQVPDLKSVVDFPYLPNLPGEKEREIESGQASAAQGPTLKGKAREIEPAPAWMLEKDRAAFLRLRTQKDKILAQLGFILKQMEALEVTAKDKNLATLSQRKDIAPIPSRAHTVTEKKTKAAARTSNSLGGQGSGRKNTPPAVPVATTAGPQESGKKKTKRKGKKTGENRNPPPSSTGPTRQKRGGIIPSQSEKGRSRPERDEPRPSTSKEGLAECKRENPPPRRSEDNPAKKDVLPLMPTQETEGG